MKKVLISMLLVSILVVNGFCTFRVLFSPRQDCEIEFVTMIENAKKSVLISCFGITNKKIADAIIDAQSRGCKVLVCADKTQSAGTSSLRDYLIKSGIEYVTKKAVVLEHNKCVTVDGINSIIGSWNFSNSAQKQDNSIVVFENEPEVAKIVEEDINWIYERDK